MNIKIKRTLTKYMKLDDYSFELHQERVDKCHTPSATVTLPFTSDTTNK